MRAAALTDRPTQEQRASEGAYDAELVARVSMREAAALAELYDRYSRRCFSLARRITADNTFAEDVVQEVFTTVWKRPTAYDSTRGAFSSWLLAMTHHKAVDAVRREETLRAHRSEREVDDPTSTANDQGTDIEDEVVIRLRGERVRDALAALPELQRQALTLAYFGGYTQREVAAITGAPLGTVKTRMLAGIRRLRLILDGITASDDGGAPA